MTYAVQCLDVHKVYRQGDKGVVGVDGVSLEIESGGFVCLRSPSGGGSAAEIHVDPHPPGPSRPLQPPPEQLPDPGAGLGDQAEEAQQVEKMLRSGVIRPSESPWASPVVMVRKK